MPQLTIPNDTFERLARQAAALNVTLEQLVTPVLEHLAETGAANGPPAIARTGNLPHDQWKARFDELVDIVRSRADRYPPGFQADVSRQSIYEGCGE